MDGRSRLRGSEQKQRRYRGLPALEWRRDRREEAANRADGEEGQAAPDLGPGFCSVLFALRDCLLPAGVAVVNVHAQRRTHTGARFGPVIPRDLPQARRAILFLRHVKCDWLVLPKSLIPIGLGVVFATFLTP